MYGSVPACGFSEGFSVFGVSLRLYQSTIRYYTGAHGGCEK